LMISSGLQVVSMDLSGVAMVSISLLKITCNSNIKINNKIVFSASIKQISFNT
jgi:hypothetical protein